MLRWVEVDLVLLPALMHAFPNQSLATVFGTNKIIAMASNSYLLHLLTLRRLRSIGNLYYPQCWQHLYFLLGAMSVSLIPKELMRYIVFFLLILIVIYTFAAKRLV